MSGDEPTKFIVATEDARTLPAVELLTGRGFVTGKSGSGKSNTVSVIAEELLGAGYNLLIVDTEGEYFGLKEQFEVLHVGGSTMCDVQIGQEQAAKIADITLEHNVPVVLNVADYLDQDEAKEIVANVIERLFILEGEYKKPFLVIVEEMQEYLPQSGGKDDLAKLLLRVAKRGRKRGLGLCGISQRPSAVDKDFITQCDWMVWHRLTWENDVEIVRKILGSEIANAVPDLDDGEGFLLTDWDDEVDRVKFRRKKTFDAGATPGLEEYERPNLKSIGPELARELRGENGLEGAELELTDSAAVEHPAIVGGEPDPDVDPETEELQATRDEPIPQLEDDLQLIPPEPTDEGNNLESMEAGDLRELVQYERRRNEILEGEVKELKEIINTIQRDRQPNEIESGSQPSNHHSDATAILEEPQREGGVGAVVELALMVTYIAIKSLDRIRNGLLAGAGRMTGSRDSQYASTPVAPRHTHKRKANRRLGIGLLLLLILAGITVVWIMLM